jgi:mRNA interferase RelE/StbE
LLRLDITKDAADFWGALDSKQYRQIGRKLLALLNDPEPRDSSRLRGADDLLRTDIGEYRIVYRADDATVYVLGIGKRNDSEA